MEGTRYLLVVFQVLYVVYTAPGVTTAEDEASRPAPRSLNLDLERQARHPIEPPAITEGPNFPPVLSWNVTPNGTVQIVNITFPSAHRKNGSAPTTERHVEAESLFEKQIKEAQGSADYHHHSAQPATTLAVTIQTNIPPATSTPATTTNTPLTTPTTTEPTTTAPPITAPTTAAPTTRAQTTTAQTTTAQAITAPTTTAPTTTAPTTTAQTTTLPAIAVLITTTPTTNSNTKTTLTNITLKSTTTTATSASHKNDLDNGQLTHGQLSRRCPVMSTGNSLTRRRKSVSHLPGAEENITEEDNKNSSLSPTPHDNLRGRRQQELAALTPEGEENLTADGEAYNEEELVKETIHRLKALLLGNYTKGTTRKRRENDAYDGSHTYFKTFTDLKKLRKMGKKNLSPAPRTATSTTTATTEPYSVNRGPRFPLERKDDSLKNPRSSGEELFPKDAGHSDSDMYFSMQEYLRGVKKKSNHTSAPPTTSTTGATRVPEQNYMEINGKQSREEPSDSDLYFSTREFLRGVKERKANHSSVVPVGIAMIAVVVVIVGGIMLYVFHRKQCRLQATGRSPGRYTRRHWQEEV